MRKILDDVILEAISISALSEDKKERTHLFLANGFPMTRSCRKRIFGDYPLYRQHLNDLYQQEEDRMKESEEQRHTRHRLWRLTGVYYRMKRIYKHKHIVAHHNTNKYKHKRTPYNITQGK